MIKLILQFDTTKIPNKNECFLAEVILASAKANCTIDESIAEMKDILKQNNKGANHGKTKD